MEAVMDDITLGDIPDLSDVNIGTDTAGPFEDGWYRAQILEKREFTDKNGNERVFIRDDEPSQSGNGRNIRLQLELTRSDGRIMNLSWRTHYRPEDLTTETIAAVNAKTESKEEYGQLFRSFKVLKALSTLQKIAGVRQLQRNGNGGLDLHPLYGKACFIRIKPDDKNPQFKDV